MQDRIDNLIAKKLSGNSTPHEDAELLRWLDQDTANAAYYAEAEKLWRYSDSWRAPDEGKDVDVAWNEFRALAGNHAPKSGQSRNMILRVAAALFFILTSFWIIVYVWPTTDDHFVVSQSVALHTDTLVQNPIVLSVTDTAMVLAGTESIASVPAKQERRASRRVVMIAVSSEDSAMVFTLPDQTKVYLNRNSKLTYPEKFTGKKRAVYLSGEAYFETSEAGEFFVYCHDTRTRSLGSAFNVKGMRDGVVEISAVTGEIEISHRKRNTSTIRLSAGEQILYDTSSQQMGKSKVTRKDKWWKRGGFRAFIKNLFNRIIHPRNYDSGGSASE